MFGYGKQGHWLGSTAGPPVWPSCIGPRPHQFKRGPGHLPKAVLPYCCDMWLLWTPLHFFRLLLLFIPLSVLQEGHFLDLSPIQPVVIPPPLCAPLACSAASFSHRLLLAHRLVILGCRKDVVNVSMSCPFVNEYKALKHFPFNHYPMQMRKQWKGLMNLCPQSLSLS